MDVKEKDLIFKCIFSAVVLIDFLYHYRKSFFHNSYKNQLFNDLLVNVKNLNEYWRINNVEF